ncbi:MAG: DUF2061 domain-containing protein [bacterium]
MNKIQHPSKVLSLPSPLAFLQKSIAEASAESHWRSILKAVSYRTLGASVTAAVTWGVTGKLYIAATIAVGETLIKIVMFYVHERVWDKIFLGRENVSS